MNSQKDQIYSDLPIITVIQLKAATTAVPVIRTVSGFPCFATTQIIQTFDIERCGFVFCHGYRTSLQEHRNTESLINSPAHLPAPFLSLSSYRFLDLAPLNLRNLHWIPAKNSSGI